MTVVLPATSTSQSLFELPLVLIKILVSGPVHWSHDRAPGSCVKRAVPLLVSSPLATRTEVLAATTEPDCVSAPVPCALTPMVLNEMSHSRISTFALTTLTPLENLVMI